MKDPFWEVWMGTVEYLVVIERSETGYSAYAPDVLGCVSAGDTVDEVKTLMREALEFHLESMQMHGEPIPDPTAGVAYITVTVPVVDVQARAPDQP